MGLFFETSGSEGDVWSVADLTAYIRELFELDYRLQDIQVEGEVSNFTRARSGHLYFTLKDEQAKLKCVMWRAGAERLRFQPAEGDTVVARGALSIYEAGGVYQLYVKQLRPAGRGELALAFERLRQQLQEEGLFDESRKQRVPDFPRRIGIVTSADAAALRDILNVLQRRCPLVEVLIAPALVQGAGAPPQLVRSLQWLDGRGDIDLIILARGGGSIEDLWAFNDEQVVRAVAAAAHPVICGVGHETDFTLADFAADVRAPTPSAAAELAVPDIAELRPAVARLTATLQRLVSANVEERRLRLQTMLRALRHVGPQGQLRAASQHTDGLVGRLEKALERRLESLQGRLAVAQARLATVSPLATLTRGYAIVRDGNGQVVRTTDQVAAGDRVGVMVADGQFGAIVEELEERNE